MIGYNFDQTIPFMAKRSNLVKNFNFCDKIFIMIILFIFYYPFFL